MIEYRESNYNDVIVLYVPLSESELARDLLREATSICRKLLIQPTVS